MRLQPWMRCECGKIHVATFVSPNTRCKCDRLLASQFIPRSTNARGKKAQ